MRRESQGLEAHVDPASVTFEYHFERRGVSTELGDVVQGRALLTEGWCLQRRGVIKELDLWNCRDFPHLVR